MRLRRRRTPLLLLPFLLPHLAIAASDPSLKSKPGSVEQLASDPLPADAPIASVQPSLQVPKDIGTKDAPVDGLDGKPHAGPFVDSGASRKKPNTVEDIVTGDRSGAKQKDISFQYEGATEKEREAHKLMLMEAQGTVMDDPNREVPKEGTTGTEGGVSERDRLKKAQELGETAEYTKPETPKEVPPLPESEQSRISKEKTAQKDKEDEVADHGAPGFEVSTEISIILGLV